MNTDVLKISKGACKDGGKWGDYSLEKMYNSVEYGIWSDRI